MKRFRLLPVLLLGFGLSACDRQSEANLPTAPEASVAFRLQGTDSLPAVDSVRFHVFGAGVDRDTTLSYTLGKGGVRKLPVGVALTATVEGLKMINGRKVVAWTATEAVTLSATVERNVVDLAPQVKSLTPIVALEFPTLLQFSGRGLGEDTLLFKSPGDTATLQFSARGLDSVWLDGKAIVAQNGVFTVRAPLVSLPLLTLVGSDRMSRSWVLAPKALDEQLVLAVAAPGRTLRTSGDTLLDSMDYVVPAGRSPLQVPGAVTVREGTQVWTAEGGVVSVAIPVPAAGSDSLHVLIGRDVLGRKDTLLVRVVRATDRTAPKVAVEVKPSAAIVAGSAVEASLTFTVVEDSLARLEVDGSERALVAGTATVTKSLGADAGWTAFWKAVDKSGNQDTGTVVLRRYSATEKDTTAPRIDSVGVDVRNWMANGVSWIRSGNVEVKVKASDDRGLPKGVWLRSSSSSDSTPLAWNGALWTASVNLSRDGAVTVVAQDSAGNASEVRSLSVRIDDQPPQILVPDPLLRGPESVPVEVTVRDLGVGLLADSLILSLDSVRKSLPTSVVGDLYTITLPRVSASGRHVLGLKACDRLLQCAVDSVVVRIDAEGPVASGLPASGSRLVADSTGGYSALLTVTDPSGVKWVKATSGNVDVSAVKDADQWSLSIPSLPQGTSSWSLQAADELGNLSSASFTAYRVASPTASVQGQVTSGTTATVSCATGVVVVNGVVKSSGSYLVMVSNPVSMVAYCLEQGVGRSPAESFTWTVGTVPNSSLTAIVDSVTDSVGALGLVFRVANPASISRAVATWPSSVSSGAPLQVPGTMDLKQGTVTVPLTGLPEGLTTVTVTVSDLDGDSWTRSVAVRRVPAPTTTQTTPFETFGAAPVTCSKADDVLWLDGVSQNAVNGSVAVKGDVSVNARCVDLAGHSSANRLLAWSLSSSAAWTLLNDNAAMSPGKQIALITTDSAGGEPILVVGNRSAASLQLLKLDRSAPGKNLGVASAVEIKELDTLVLARGRDAEKDGWVAGVAGRQIFVAQVLSKGALEKPVYLNPSILGDVLTVAGWSDVHAAVSKDSVFIVAYDSAVQSYRAFAYLMSKGTYATLDLDGTLRKYSGLWVSDLGKSSKALLLSAYDWKSNSPVTVQVPSGTSFANNCGIECGGTWFPQVGKEAGLGWLLSSPLPGNANGKWTLTALASSLSTSGGGSPSWSYEGGDPLAAPSKVFFGATQGWIAQSGSFLWRFELTDPSAVKSVAKVPGVVAGGVVDPDGHAWVVCQNGEIWKLLRASP